MSSQHIDVRYTANLARVNLTDEECDKFQEQLNAIVGYIDTLSNVDIKGIEPTAHAAPIFDHLREDKAEAGLTQEDLLRNAPDSALGQIRVPKVVDA